MRALAGPVCLTMLLALPCSAWAGGGDIVWSVLQGLGSMAKPPEDRAACAEAQRICTDYTLTSAQFQQLRRIFVKNGRDPQCLDVCSKHAEGAWR
jgi:hypothetical protein